MTADEKHMARALALARRAWGRTSPNPMVGAVVVRAGRVVGEGWHRRAGTPHAEIHALRAAGARAHGATLYVTLEPCSTAGRTPPCTEAILAAGVGRVVAAGIDPNPRHAGRGLAWLRERGLDVTVGTLEKPCRELNEAFFTWIRHRRPFVLLKLAITLDGRIATRGGDSKWITAEPARRHVQRLRQWADAILVGAGTVRRDNPALTVRTPQNWPRQPRKLVWTRRRTLPRRYRIWDDPANPPEFLRAGTADEWRSVLEDLGRREVTALLIEGGGEVAASALAAGVVDKVAFYISPTLLGGRHSRPAVGGPDPASLSDACRLRETTVRRIGPDLLVCGYPVRA